MIEVRGLTKRYGDTVAVDDVSFDVAPGTVTGFLGPNGAGKSTTMRMILGLDHPSAGSATIDGQAYRDAPAPMSAVGAVLDAKAIHGGRTARQHLRWLARAGGIPLERADELLEVAGLGHAAGRRVGGFSLGMFQRLGIATALLGDPRTLILDEPVNGLDPDGILWVRTLLRGLAAEGRTILVSSHLMSEMERTADHVLVIGGGRLIADAGIAEFTRRSSTSHVRVASPQAAELTPLLLARPGAAVASSTAGELLVTGLEAADVGEVAAVHGIRLHELTPQRATLESAYMERTRAGAPDDDPVAAAVLDTGPEEVA